MTAMATMSLRTLRRATLLTLFLVVLGTVQYHIIFHIQTHSHQHDHQVEKEMSQGVTHLKELEFKEWHSKKVKRLVGHRWPTTEPVVREGEGRILPGNFQRVREPLADGVRFPLDKDRSIEGHSSHSAPRGSLKTLSPPSENTGKLSSSNGNHRSPLLAGTPKQERPSRDSLSDVNAPLLGNTLSVSHMKAISRRGQLREPLRMRTERQTTSEVTSDVHKFSHKKTRETSSMEKANHIEGERLSVSVRELAGTKIAGDQLAGKDERDTKSTAGSKQPTSGQLSSIRRAGEASSINSHSLAHSEDAIGVLSSKIPNNPKRGYETDRIPISKQRTNFVDKQLPAKPDLEYDHEKQLLFQYIMETNPHWLTWDESKVAKNIITNTRRMSMVTRRTIRSTTMTLS